MAETAQNNKKVAKSENNDRLEWLRNKGFIKTLEQRNEKGQVVETGEAVIYKGLLALAHEDGLKRLFTQDVQLPSKENGNTAIFFAEVETNKGTFRCHGDANPENVDQRIVPHFIRMAETRAKARALRDAENIGLVCAEEFDIEMVGNGVMVTRATNGKPKQVRGEKANDQAKALPPAPASQERPIAQPRLNGNGNSKPKRKPEETRASAPAAKASVPEYSPNREDPMTDKQRNFLFRLASDRGHSGEEAHQYLKETFGVDSLKRVTKAEAKQVIDQWLREARGEREEVPF